MRALPAGWPAADAKVRTPPVVYLRLPGSAWPPASVQGGEQLPAGTTRVGEWSVDCDLDAPLLPGQVNTSTKLAVAEASCTIPQPKGGLLAPWMPAAQAPPKSGACELIASYDGPSGATAFTLGKFVLDPIKGRLSEKFLTLTMVQDLVRLRRTHDMPVDVEPPGSFGPHLSGRRLLEWAAARNGYAIVFPSGEFAAWLEGSYFPAKTDELTAMQQIAAANLGALVLSMDGHTLKAFGPGYLAGDGDVVETLDVLTKFEDLSWSQDPGAVADRVEVSFVPPQPDDSPWGPAPNYNAAPVFTFPANARLVPGQAATFHFDPGTIITPRDWNLGSNARVYGTTGRDGTGDVWDLPAEVTQISSSHWAVKVTNTTDFTRYLMAPFIPPFNGDGTAASAANSSFPKGTRSVLVGTIDRSSTNEPTVLAWGVSAEAATNTIRFDLGRNIHYAADATNILNWIRARVADATWTVEDVNVVPHLGRELADIALLALPPVDGIDQPTPKVMVTGLKTSGDSTGIRQTMSLAILD